MGFRLLGKGFVRAVLPLTSALLIGWSACAGAAEQYSGFIQDMPPLEERKDDAGTVARYVSPSLSSGMYTKVLLEPVQIFPEPQPSDKVDAATLGQIEGYLDEALRREIGQRVELTDKAGPGVARVRVALTGAKAEAAALKPYQYVPIALVLNVAADATGVKKKDAKLYGEVEVLDSVSGERLAVVVRESKGKKMKEAGDQVSLDDVKPLIDHIAVRGAAFLAETMRAK